MITFVVGDVVQLKSGGAPLTLIDINSRGEFLLACVSTGGLAQEVRCTKESVRLYLGEPTRATRK